MRALGWIVCVSLAGCSFHVGGFGKPAPGGVADLASPLDVDAAMSSPDLSMPDLATPSLAPMLTGSVDDPGATTPIDLSGGARDWAHWGFADQNSFDHKTGTNLISNFTNVTNSPMQWGNPYPVGFSWSDGTPTSSATNSVTGVYTYGSGAGFRITVPADNTLHTLRIWAGGQQSTATVTAHLTDGSIADYTKTSGDSGGNYQRLITLSFRASVPCVMRVDWTVSSGTYVHLQSAVLQ
jgi:hypothetical protein